MKDQIPYIHDEQAHNLTDPGIIVPILVDVLNPKSAIDIGCGIGTFLNVFKKLGVTDIIGHDGKWVDRTKLSKHISTKHFIETNLEQNFSINREFDVGVCLEVIEHINEESGIRLVEELANHCKYIIFSCAIPGQKGQNHINEQWPTYWNDKFAKHGLVCYDVFRPILWNNKSVARWYKQNMFLYTKPENEEIIKQFEAYFDSEFKNYVHPDYYNISVKEVNQLISKLEQNYSEHKRLVNGQDKFNKYMKMFVKKLLFTLAIRK